MPLSRHTRAVSWISYNVNIIDTPPSLPEVSANQPPRPFISLHFLELLYFQPSSTTMAFNHQVKIPKHARLGGSLLVVGRLHLSRGCLYAILLNNMHQLLAVLSQVKYLSMI